MGVTSSNFGSVFASLSVTSASMYVVSLIWTFEMASKYMFLPMKFPTNLYMFLNASACIMDISLIPVDIPNPLESVSY